MKNKNTILLRTLSIVCVIIIFGNLAIGLILSFISEIKKINNYVEAKDIEMLWEAAHSVNYVKAEELSMREWVKQEILKVGLNWEEVNCIIQSESSWNPYAYNVNWNNKTTDMGLFQINSQHKKTASVECRMDYKCSTKWAISKRLRDGNWNAWYGYLKNCQ